MISSATTSPVARLSRFALTPPPGCDFRAPREASSEPTDRVVLSGAGPAERVNSKPLGKSGFAVALMATASLLGLAGAAHAAPPPQQHPVTQSQPKSKAHEAGKQLNQAGKQIARPFAEAGKEIGKQGKEVGQEIGQAGKEFGLGVARQSVEFGHGVRDFFKGLGGK